jgi:hypothetical protein
LVRFFKGGAKPIALVAAALALCLPGSLQAQPTLIDFGFDAPVPGTDDVYQLTSGSEGADGMNYYFDNASPPGQIFKTGTNPFGYTLNSVTIATADNAGSIPAAGQAYILRIYSVSGSTATLVKTYRSQDAFVFTDNDWLQWTNLDMILFPDSQYAYTFARVTAGWERLGNVSGNPYPDGEVVLIPTGGGAITLGPTHDFDAAFLVGLTPMTTISANAPMIAPSAAVFVGTSVTNSVVVVGPQPYYCQWRTDGGGGGALTNIPNATSTSLVIDTTGYAVGVYKYDVVVTNSTTSVTSAVATLAVVAPTASAALTDIGSTPAPGANDLTQFVGGGDPHGEGLNYYDDNGANNDGWTGQTFTTGDNTQGYYLTSVGFQTGGSTSTSGTGVVQPYHLYIYGVEGANAFLMAHYTNGAFSFTDGNWLKWSGFNLTLKPNKTYAYAFGRDASGTGWEALAVSPSTSDAYAGGQMCLIPAAGGTITFGSTGLGDAVFDLGLLPIGVGPDPKPFAGLVTVVSGRIVTAGTAISLTQAATGEAPLAFQWRTDGGSGGTLTNIPSATDTNLVVDTTGFRPAVYKFDFVVSNSFGTATASAVAITVAYTNGAAILTDIGASTPLPLAMDVAQTILPAGYNSPDGLNYYFDNATPPGQTFTTGGNTGGYVMTSLAINMAGNNGGSLPAAGQSYVLRIYSVSGTNAVLYATYTSQSAFTFTSQDWLRWSDFELPLSANSTYAYTLARDPAGTGWENLGNVSGNPYPDGEVVLIPPAGGGITFGSSHDNDGTFEIGLALPGYPHVTPVQLSLPATIYAGSPVTLSVNVTGTGPFTYQWRTDGGNMGAALTNIAGATGASLAVDTTGLDGMVVTYDVIVTSADGSTTSEQSPLTILGASAPIVKTETAPTSATLFAGENATFTASFEGTLPITYQWQIDRGTGAVDVPGQTNATLSLTNVQVSDSGSYSLLASNIYSPLSSTPALLTVLPKPVSPFTVNFQWHSTEGSNDVGNYTGPGVTGYGTGTYWNQVNGPSAWSPGTYSGTNGLADDGQTDYGITWTLTTGGSWDWTSTPTVALLDSSASAYAVQPFTFRLPNGRYNIVLFSCNGTEAPGQTNGGTIFIINGQTNTALPTTNTKFVEGDNYVVFSGVSVTNYTLAGTWQPVAGKSYGSLNGAQLRFLGPAVTLSMHRVATGKIELQWPSGTLIQAPSLAGPWTTNALSSPATVDTTNSMMFYRVVVQ